jgi:hypothetical protein
MKGVGMWEVSARLASFRPWRLLPHKGRCRPRHALLDSIALIMPDTVTTRRSTTKTCFSALRSERGTAGRTIARVSRSKERKRFATHPALRGAPAPLQHAPDQLHVRGWCGHPSRRLRAKRGGKVVCALLQIDSAILSQLPTATARHEQVPRACCRCSRHLLQRAQAARPRSPSPKQRRGDLFNALLFFERTPCRLIARVATSRAAWRGSLPTTGARRLPTWSSCWTHRRARPPVLTRSSSPCTAASLCV